MLTYDNGTVELAIFTDDGVITGVFVIAVLTIVLANIHLLIGLDKYYAGITLRIIGD